MADRIGAGEMQISEVVDGFVSTDEADDYVAEEDFDEFDEEDDDDGQGGSKALTKKLEELKAQALERFAMVRVHFDKMRKAYEKDGYSSASYARCQHLLTNDLMTIRFTVKTIEKLCDVLRSQVDDVRRFEREIRKIVVDRCGMAQEHFIRTFPPNILNLKWAERGNCVKQAGFRVGGSQVRIGIQDLRCASCVTFIQDELKFYAGCTGCQA